MFEVFDEATFLKSYSGSDSGLKGEIRIKGHGWRGSNHVGNLCNDIGFEQQSDGTFLLHICDYATNRLGRNWQDKLTQQYSGHVIKKTAMAYGFEIEEEEINTKQEQLIKLTRSF